PALADRHGEALAQLSATEPGLEVLRAAILDAAIHAPDLDKAALAHTLGLAGLATLGEDIRQSTRLRFSFTRPETSLALASEHFGLVMGNLTARRRIDEELTEMTLRLRDSMSESDYAAQQSLIAERQRVNDQLMSLAARERDADGA
ncbi:MAG: hypothetical protein ACRCUI_00925, partial [Polymorphobacter sp.]